VSFGRVLLQFMAIPVFARLLGPYPYGLMAIAMPIIGIATQICDFGLSAILVREKERSAEDTAFWLAAGATLLSLAGVVVAAVLVGEWVHPQARAVLLAMTVMLPLTLLMSVPIARLTREHRLGIIAFGDGAGVVLGLGAAFYGALSGWGVWSLVLQQIVLLIARSASYVVAARYRPRFGLARGRVGELLRASISVTGANLFGTASRTLDNFLVGTLVGARAAGAYSMTYQFVRLPDMIIGGPVSMALTAKFARAENTGGAHSGDGIYLAAMRSLSLLTLPAMIGLAFVAAPFVNLFLGPQWHGADRILVALCGAGVFVTMGTVNLAALTGIGAYGPRLTLSWVLLAAVIAGVFAGSPLGAVGVGYGVSIGYALHFAWASVLVSQRLGLSPFAVLGAMWPAIVGSGVMALVLYVAQRELGPQAGDWAQILVLVAAGAGSYVLALLAFRRRRVIGDVQELAALFG